MQKPILLILASFQLVSAGSSALAYDLPPPPAKGSVAYQNDFAILHQYQEQRTEEECARADLQSSPTVDNLFGPSTGILTKDEIKKVAVSGEHVIERVMDLTDPFKNLHLRNRPYITDTSLSPCIELPGKSNRSYPSGHSAVGIVLASFLAKQFPAKKEAILKQGNQIGINRLIGGVHHPSDVAAGQSLGRQIVKDLADL